MQQDNTTSGSSQLLFETIADIAYPRLDTCAAEDFELFTRSQYKQRVTGAWINDRRAKPSSRVQAGDAVRIEYLPEVEITLEPQNIPLEILHEDQNVLVVNKARGMVVHPGAGNPDGTLVNAFLYHCGQNRSQWDEDALEAFRPGIVHRLDKDTSGVIILAKNSATLEFLASQFRNRETGKLYAAILDGSVDCTGRIEGYIRRSESNRMLFVWDDKKGKTAATSYRRIGRGQVEGRNADLVLYRPETGRTHQLRVHSARLKAPIVGDPLYNRRSFAAPLMLHAWALKIQLPGEDAPRAFYAPLPGDMSQVLSEGAFLYPEEFSPAHIRGAEELFAISSLPPGKGC